MSGCFCAIAIGGLDGALKAIPLLLGVTFVIMGNISPKIPYKAWGGLRNPITMHSKDIWMKTHRYLGQYYVTCGAMIMLCSFLPSTDITYGIISTITAIAVLAPIGYAYKLKLSEQPKSE